MHVSGLSHDSSTIIFTCNTLYVYWKLLLSLVKSTGTFYYLNHIRNVTYAHCIDSCDASLDASSPFSHYALNGIWKNGISMRVTHANAVFHLGDEPPLYAL